MPTSSLGRSLGWHLPRAGCTLDLGAAALAPVAPTRHLCPLCPAAPHSRARREEGRGEGGADNGPGPGGDGSARSRAGRCGAGRWATAGGALLSSAPGGVQPLPAFMLVVPPSVRADEVSPSPAGSRGGDGAGPHSSRWLPPELMRERCPRPPRPERGEVPLEAGGHRVLPPFWVGNGNGFAWGRHKVSSLHTT